MSLSINKNTKKYSILPMIILFILFYALFSPDRIKKTFSLIIHERNVTNEIWLIPLATVISYLYIKQMKRKVASTHNFYIGICIYIYLIVIAIGAFNATSFSQYIYASLIFTIPFLMLFVTSHLNREEIDYIIKRIILINLIYSILAIILSTNYAYFMNLMGNPVDDYRYYSQYRASMMIGSSITVSYYMNLTLPLCFYLFYSSDNRKWKIISSLAILTNIIATLVLLSRNATFTMLVITLLSFFLLRAKRGNYKTKVAMVVGLVISGIIASNSYDLSRLMNGFSSQGNSISERLEAGNLGIYIFSKYPIFGSGMGKFFERIYDNRNISVDGVPGLVDPHNMYIFMLSELGLIGLCLLALIIFILFRSFSLMRNKILRRTGYITLIAFIINQAGGSQLINEISYSVVFWTYIGLFNAHSLKFEEKG
ncbi:O-antigen ligase family protein [Priestia endophytica]|uniref:O-antigen ligase family protein n=1 Tax=Priestia endophytica TaxID=135735 RepID=UPI00124C3FC0|nr:O-antigen ligase family protein [Priestia endophytica]KAB2494538.1 O-antigen ligase family protein [Priestia endophytica]